MENEWLESFAVPDRIVLGLVSYVEAGRTSGQDKIWNLVL